MASRANRLSQKAAIGIVVLLGATTWLTGCGNDTESSTPKTTEQTSNFRDEIQGLQRDKPINTKAATLPEVNEDGSTTPFSFIAPENKLLFIAFGYTNCPDVCPTTLTDIRSALGLLEAEEAKNVNVAFATVDPERDTADVMVDYLNSFVKDGHPLRPESNEQLLVAEKALGITSEVKKNDDGTVDVAHTAKSFVINDQGDVVVEWAFGTGADQMASDLRLLLADR